MTRSLSQRIALTFLLVAAAIIWTREIRTPRWEPCADADRLTNALELPKTITEENRLRGAENPLTFAWKSGELEKPVGDLDYHIIRSDQGINHILNISRVLQRLHQPTRNWVEERSVDGRDVPIHWSSQSVELGSRYFVARLDFLGTRPIHSIFWSSLRTAPSQLIYGTLPVTSYIVEASSNSDGELLVRRLASEWLEAVVRRNREACES